MDTLKATLFSLLLGATIGVAIAFSNYHKFIQSGWAFAITICTLYLAYSIADRAFNNGHLEGLNKRPILPILALFVSAGFGKFYSEASLLERIEKSKTITEQIADKQAERDDLTVDIGNNIERVKILDKQISQLEQDSLETGMADITTHLVPGQTNQIAPAPAPAPAPARSYSATTKLVADNPTLSTVKLRG